MKKKYTISIIIITILLLPISISKTIYLEISKEKIIKEINKYEKRRLIKAISEIESNFNPYAKSNKNAYGLTQIRPVVWREELIEEGIIRHDFDLFSYKRNIKACNYIVSKLNKRYKGNLRKTMNHYSGDKTGKYYKKVMKHYGRN